MSKRRLGILLASAVAIGASLSSLVREARGTGSVAVNAPGSPAQCKSDAECDNRFFCDGKERCHVAGAAADARGCSSGTPPCTVPGQVCNSTMARCEIPCPDADGDGHTSISCGGDDCDDSNAARYPGNHEYCDPGNVDEDCDPWTYGQKDVDQDGEDDARCCNVDASGTWRCGTDADDSRYQIRRGSQVCDGEKVYTDRFTTEACPTGTVCIPQPNGQGVCGVAPPGYKTPPAAFAPAPDAPLPPPKIVKPRLGPVPTRPRLSLPNLAPSYNKKLK